MNSFDKDFLDISLSVYYLVYPNFSKAIECLSSIRIVFLAKLIDRCI